MLAPATHRVRPRTPSRDHVDTTDDPIADTTIPGRLPAPCRLARREQPDPQPGAGDDSLDRAGAGQDRTRRQGTGSQDGRTGLAARGDRHRADVEKRGRRGDGRRGSRYDRRCGRRVRLAVLGAGVRGGWRCRRRDHRACLPAVRCRGRRRTRPGGPVQRVAGCRHDSTPVGGVLDGPGAVHIGADQQRPGAVLRYDVPADCRTGDSVRGAEPRGQSGARRFGRRVHGDAVAGRRRGRQRLAERRLRLRVRLGGRRRGDRHGALERRGDSGVHPRPGVGSVPGCRVVPGTGVADRAMGRHRNALGSREDRSPGRTARPGLDNRRVPDAWHPRHLRRGHRRRLGHRPAHLGRDEHPGLGVRPRGLQSRRPATRPERRARGRGVRS